jgi:hypothetical protein
MSHPELILRAVARRPRLAVDLPREQQPNCPTIHERLEAASKLTSRTSKESVSTRTLAWCERETMQVTKGCFANVELPRERRHAAAIVVHDAGGIPKVMQLVLEQALRG